MGGRLLGEAWSPLQKSFSFPYHFNVEIVTETKIVGLKSMEIEEEKFQTDKKRDQNIQGNVIPWESYALFPFKPICLLIRTR